MARIIYFADLPTGETVTLANVGFEGGNTKNAANFSGLLPTGQRVRATRKVEYKSFASKHECDARCMNATGRTMQCECACGGKNHGKGRVSFVCEAA